jgi:hypothetical protein
MFVAGFRWSCLLFRIPITTEECPSASLVRKLQPWPSKSRLVKVPTYDDYSVECHGCMVRLVLFVRDLGHILGGEPNFTPQYYIIINTQVWDCGFHCDWRFKLMLIQFLGCASRGLWVISPTFQRYMRPISSEPEYIHLTHQHTRFNLGDGGRMYLRSLGNI